MSQPKQGETPYGEWIEDPNHPGDHNYNRGYGLRCYQILKEDKHNLGRYFPCTVCKTKDEMDSIYGAD